MNGLATTQHSNAKRFIPPAFALRNTIQRAESDTVLYRANRPSAMATQIIPIQVDLVYQVTHPHRTMSQFASEVSDVKIHRVDTNCQSGTIRRDHRILKAHPMFRFYHPQPTLNVMTGRIIRGGVMNCGVDTLPQTTHHRKALRDHRQGALNVRP